MPDPIPATKRRADDFASLVTAINCLGEYVKNMRERVRLLEAVVDNFPGGISLFDSDLRMVLCNEQQKQLLEYPDELLAAGRPTLEQLFRFNAMRGEYGAGDVEEHVRHRMELAREMRPHVYERTRPNGIIVEVRGVPLKGGGFVTTYFDVTEQRRSQQTIAHMAHHDPLTDLPNRMLFNDRLHNALALARRSGMMAVHYLDVDGFKPVNDNHGHQTGDALLVAIAERMRLTVRENDTVARLGGDEFAIVQTGIHRRDDAAVLATRILAQFGRPFEVLDKSVSIGVSIGIAVAPGDASDSDDLLQKADAALYHCKSAGRGTFSFYEMSA